MIVVAGRWPSFLKWCADMQVSPVSPLVRWAGSYSAICSSSLSRTRDAIVVLDDAWEHAEDCLVSRFRKP